MPCYGLPLPKIRTCPCHCPIHGRRMPRPKRIRPSPYPMFNYCFNGPQPNGFSPYPTFGAVPTAPFQPQNYVPQFNGFQPHMAGPMQQPPPEISSKDVRNKPTGALNVLQKRYKKECKNNPETGLQTPREEEIEEKFMEALKEKDRQVKAPIPPPLPMVIQNRSFYTFPMRTVDDQGASARVRNQRSFDERMEDSPIKDAILDTLRVTSPEDHFKAALNEHRTGGQKIETANIGAPAAANTSTFGPQKIVSGHYNLSQLDEAAQNCTLEDMRNATIYINAANEAFNIALDEAKKKKSMVTSLGSIPGF